MEYISRNCGLNKVFTKPKFLDSTSTHAADSNVILLLEGRLQLLLAAATQGARALLNLGGSLTGEGLHLSANLAGDVVLVVEALGVGADELSTLPGVLAANVGRMSDLAGDVVLTIHLNGLVGNILGDFVGLGGEVQCELSTNLGLFPGVAGTLDKGVPALSGSDFLLVASGHAGVLLAVGAGRVLLILTVHLVLVLRGSLLVLGGLGVLSTVLVLRGGGGDGGRSGNCHNSIFKLLD